MYELTTEERDAIDHLLTEQGSPPAVGAALVVLGEVALTVITSIAIEQGMKWASAHFGLGDQNATMPVGPAVERSFLKAGLPPRVAATLALIAASATRASNQWVRTKLTGMGTDPLPSTPEDRAAMIAESGVIILHRNGLILNAVETAAFLISAGLSDLAPGEYDVTIKTTPAGQGPILTLRDSRGHVLGTFAGSLNLAGGYHWTAIQ